MLPTPWPVLWAVGLLGSWVEGVMTGICELFLISKGMLLKICLADDSSWIPFVKLRKRLPIAYFLRLFAVFGGDIYSVVRNGCRVYQRLFLPTVGFAFMLLKTEQCCLSAPSSSHLRSPSLSSGFSSHTPILPGEY